jgi:heme exporter protein B
MLLVEVLVFPVFAVLFNLSLAEPGLIVVAALATLGIATVGTVFAAMAANTRAREVMLPLLFFPAALPAIVGAVEATGLVLGDGGLGDTYRWITLLLAFDAVFLVVAPLAFKLVIEE